jgi:hypothetical protein
VWVQLLEFQTGVLQIVFLVLLVVKMWAMVDAVTRPAQAYLAANKWNKPAWVWLLGAGLVAQILFQHPFGFLSLLFTVAAFVYLLDARPALSAVTRRR